jgi:hypothetical protein
MIINKLNIKQKLLTKGYDVVMMYCNNAKFDMKKYKIYKKQN